MNYKEKETCLWCGESITKMKIQKGYQEPQKFTICYCEKCNTSYSLPRVSDDKLYELIYANSEKIRGYVRYFNYQKEILENKNPLKFLSDNEPIYWAPSNVLSKLKKGKREIKILEVGSGLGYFTYALNKAGYNVIGLDISQVAVTDAIKKFGDYYICDDLHHYASMNENSFDVVIMTEVIEHLDNPKDFIRSIMKLLNTNGKCIFTTPNKSFSLKESIWDTDAPPVHCWWFSEESIKHMADEMHLNLDFVDFSNYYKHFPSIYPINRDFDYEGDYVFNINNEVINDISKTKKKKTTPHFIKKNRYYLFLRNLILSKSTPGFYKKGKIQSTVLCAVLSK